MDEISQNIANCLNRRRMCGEVVRFSSENVLSLHKDDLHHARLACDTGAKSFELEPEEKEMSEQVQWILNCHHLHCSQTLHQVSLFPACSRFNYAWRPNAVVDATAHVAIVPSHRGHFSRRGGFHLVYSSA